VELLVVLAIVSILAVTAIPFAETAVQRRQEIALRETLRETRRAVDRFHEDWRAERIAPDAEGASAAGYPETLEVLVEGIALDGDAPEMRRYLRRIPRNPFGGGWRLRGSAQAPGEAWDGEDVWDLSADTDRTALDGSRIADW
jgi:general secretion pathway protein G